MSTFLLDDLCQVYLPAQSLSLTFGTNLFAGLMPDANNNAEIPDAVTAISEFPGEAPEYLMGPSSLPAWTIPHIQVLSRNPSYTGARATCDAIVRALEKVVNQTINTTYYERIERLQDPFFLHRDVNRRVFFACNMKVMRTPS